MLEHLKNEFNETKTENGAFAYKSTKSDVLDLFALGGAYRERNEVDIVKLFSKAFAENPLLSMKTLFFIRDIRGGVGERRFFKVALKHIALHSPDVLRKNLHLVSEFGRFDDLWVLLETPLKSDVLDMVKKQLIIDKASDSPSNLAKWMSSENASSPTTKKYAKIMREYYGATPREYRKLLSALRKKIDLVETKLTEKNYEAIDYSKLPSKAGLIYRDAFYRNDEERYTNFLDSLSKGETTINAGTLFPYDIVNKIIKGDYFERDEMEGHEAKLLDGQWKALPNYIGDNTENSIAVVDVSGSMFGTPINVAISLGIYLAENNKGLFHNHFFTFSSKPELLEIKGSNIVEKVQNMESSNWGMSTNIESVFEKILSTAVKNSLPVDEMIDKLYVISDMMFDESVSNADSHTFKKLEEKFNESGYKMPNLVFWNVDARQSSVPFKMDEKGVMLVSGFSPSIFKNLIGKKDINPYEMMLEVIESDRYSEVIV